MLFPKLEIDRRMATWNQVFDRLLGATAENRPKLMAIADLLTGRDKGMSREEFAGGFCVGGRQLRRWIHRFNSGGLAELLYKSRRKRGRKRKISVEKFNTELFPLIQDLRAKDGKLNGRKLWRLIKTKPGCDISYPAMMQMLKRSGISFRR